MRIKHSLVGSIAALSFAASTQATTLQIDWTGVIYASTDLTGNVFHNGAGNNTGIGTLVSGQITWSEPRWNLGEHNGVAAYDQDIDGNGPGSYHAAELDPFVSTYMVGSESYTSELNFGSYNWAFLADLESGANRDAFSIGIRSSGYYQVGPTLNGISDHVSVFNHLNLNLERLWGGDLINGTGVLQNFDWTSSVNDSTVTKGGFSLYSTYWEDGTDSRFTGTQTAILEHASASFALTSLKAHTVPEPTTLSLLALGLLGTMLTQTRK